MPISHFSTNLQQSMNWFHKEHQMDPRFHDTISEDLDDHNNYHYTTATNSQQQQHYNLYNNHQPTAIQINNYNNKEPMFEKPLTPSDVGKLNRLVIPKQHAEKYFPLNGSNFINSSNNNDSPPSSGTLLGFEDESGKSWRFRYSYWNSSQSYVLTKGWSRYVKEKRLNAGDVVFFERDLVSPDRLFIGWRRRAGGGGGGGGSSSSRVAAVQDGVRSSYGNGHVMRGGYVGQDTSICSSSGADGVVGFGISPPYRSDHASSFHTGTSAMQSHKQTPGSGTNNSNMRNKRLFRLFGVNLECQPDDYSQSQTTSSESSSLSSQQQQQQQGPSSSSSVYGGNYFDYAAGSNGNGYHHHQSHYHHHHHQMDINYPQGVNNQMGNRLDS